MSFLLIKLSKKKYCFLIDIELPEPPLVKLEKDKFFIRIQNVGETVYHLNFLCIPLNKKVEVSLNIYSRILKRGDSVNGEGEIRFKEPGKTSLELVLEFIDENYQKIVLRKKISFKTFILPK